MAFQLIRHNPLSGIEIFSPGRWRMVHTNAIAYGFIANALLGSMFWAVPRLTLRPVLSKLLSWFIFIAWQGVVLATAGGILLGQAQGLEWGETPTWIDPNHRGNMPPQPQDRRQKPPQPRLQPHDQWHPDTADHPPMPPS